MDKYMYNVFRVNDFPPLLFHRLSPQPRPDFGMFGWRL